MIIMIVIGFVCSKGNKNNEDYFLGGRNLGSWTAAMSAQASDMSGWLLMGLPGAVYLAGTGEAWIAVGLLIGTILNWYIVSARLRKYTIVAGNSLTIPSFFKNRYRDHKNIIKIVSASIIAVFFTVYTASAFSSGAKLFATLFSDSASGDENYNRVYVIGLIVAAVVILVYTFMGGFKAVCTTDLIQGLMMIVAILTVPVLAYAILTFDTSFSSALAAKGVEQPAQFLNFFVNGDGTPVSAVSIISNLAWGLGYFGMPHILVRFMSIEKPSMIKKSSIVAIIWVVISLFSAVMIAYFGRMIMGEELLTHGNQKLVFIAMSRKFFPAGICGLLLAAIIAASISTADSQLLVASSSFTADLYKPFFRKGASEKETLLVGRVLVLVLSLIAFAIANSKGSGAQAIMDMVENAWGAFGSSFGPTILLSLFWKRFNYKGAVAGVVSGFVVDLGWLLSGLTASTGVYEIVPGFIVSFLAAYLVARFTEAPNAEAVAIFEEATKPDAD